MSKLIKEYFQYQDKFVKKYGSDTIVLMQVGSFYEFYGLDIDKLSYKDVDASLNLDNTHLYTVAKLLGFSIAKKTNHTLMAGVPKYAIDKHVKKLLDNNYTIVIIEQIGEDKKDVDRQITNIYSPGTYMDDINTIKTNFLASIYIENTKTLHGNTIEMGACCIDLSIGKNIIYEIPYKKEDSNYIYDELYKFINSYNPSEIIVSFKDIDENKQNNIIESLEINKRIIKTVNYGDSYKKIDIQEMMLKEVFKPKTMISVFEYLDIHRMQIGIYSYINLLLFIKEHDNSKLLHLEKPDIYTTSNLLNLNRNTIYRLNLVNNNNQEENNTSIKSLFDVVNMTTTNIGRRTLRNRLIFPTTNIDVLNKRYDLADYFIENKELMTLFKGELCNISDIERLNRKLVTLKLDKENDLLNLCISLNYINKIFDNISSELFSLLSLDEENKKEFEVFYNEIKNTFDMDKLYSRDINIFKSGFNQSIDEKNGIYKKQIVIFEELCRKFTKIIKMEDKKVYDDDLLLVDYEWSDRDNCYNITTTEARAKKLKLGLQKKKNIKIKKEEYDIDITIDTATITLKSASTGGKTKIKSDFLTECSEKLYRSKNILLKLVDNTYKTVLEDFYKYNNLLFTIVNFIGEIDCGMSTANNFIKYNYCKPVLDNTKDKSYFDCIGIRHPIIERILSTLYVTNDIIMGKAVNDGMLLFGTNSCGKSSLMKAIGLCVIMSQAGLYVPASSFTIQPFTKIFSRIGNQDNIFTGKSSFTQEISELRDIFNRCDQNSLVIGDEPCSGTEHISAISIVSSSIEYLCRKKCSFIFATHLHKLNEIDLLKNLDNLHKYHLKITYDEVNDKLIYNRKLEPGIGNEEYGLEVAKSLSLELDFLHNAYKVKNQLKDIGLYSTKGSIYNSKKILDKCELCCEEGEEVHHINYQNLANKFGHIDTIHMNMKGNLCSICQKCHDMVHNDEINIKGYIETSEGIILDYEIVEKQIQQEVKKTKKKYSEEEMKWLIMCYKTNERSTYKQLSAMFEVAQKKKISVGIVSKIIKGTY